jgi:hypothetical protein
MADDEGPQLLFSAGEGNWHSGSLSVAGEYDPKITKEVNRQIRNMPFIVNHCLQRARDLLDATGSSNFEIVLSTTDGGKVYKSTSDVIGRSRHLKSGAAEGSTDKPVERQRPRAYVAPANNKGIHEELSQAVLLKAAMGMAGK